MTSSTSTTTTVSGLGGNTTGGAVIGAQGAQQQGKGECLISLKLHIVVH